jgi:diguanylate cyclase (GGDEF)-like protein/PAS domain S-box-containing protein
MKPTYTNENLEESQNTLNNILDIVSEGIWDWDAVTGHVTRSPGWYRMLDYPIDHFNNDVYTWENIIHPDDYDAVMKHFEEYTTGEIDEYRIKYRCKKRDGSYLWIEDSGKIVERTKDGSVARMIGAHTNIHKEETSNDILRTQNELLLSDNLTLETLVEKRADELEKLNKQLEEKIELSEYNASYDIVTNIYNRRKFEEVFTKELNRVKRYSYELSVILLDIDNFKLFNDNFGHKTGDKILSSLADMLKNNIRDIDTLARWGGEEFIIILPNTSKDDSINKAEQLRKKIELDLSVDDKKITCSFGITSYVDGDDANSIFMRTDEALYLAKNNNRNNVKVL